MRKRSRQLRCVRPIPPQLADVGLVASHYAGAFAPVESLRSTALANGTAERFPELFTSSTLSCTAACAGMRSRWHIWTAPSRSATRTSPSSRETCCDEYLCDPRVQFGLPAQRAHHQLVAQRAVLARERVHARRIQQLGGIGAIALHADQYVVGKASGR